jgi:hypothetical protein
MLRLPFWRSTSNPAFSRARISSRPDTTGREAISDFHEFFGDGWGGSFPVSL